MFSTRQFFFFFFNFLGKSSFNKAQKETPEGDYAAEQATASSNPSWEYKSKGEKRKSKCIKTRQFIIPKNFQLDICPCKIHELQILKKKIPKIIDYGTVPYIHLVHLEVINSETTPHKIHILVDKEMEHLSLPTGLTLVGLRNIILPHFFKSLFLFHYLFNWVFVVLVLGFANLVADGISMGLGDYISSRIQKAVAANERAITEWDVKNHRGPQQLELLRQYEALGMDINDATTVCTYNHGFFLF